MKAWLEKHWQTLVNWFLVLSLGRYAIIKSLETWHAGKLDFVEVTFAIHNVIGLGIILAREDHRAIETRIWPQVVALLAFFSGIWFDLAPNASETLLQASRYIIFAVLILGTITLLNIGRSFGILIAARTMRSHGMYAWVRHPMYLTDILWRVGYICKNPSPWNLALFVISSGAYVWRAILEEQFWNQFPEYQEYQKQVRYRFIPGVF